MISLDEAKKLTEKFRVTPLVTIPFSGSETPLSILEKLAGDSDFSGNADLAMAFRTAVLRDGKGFVQADVGIVLDSVPESENQETFSKASAPLKAVAIANTMSKLS